MIPTLYRHADEVVEYNWCIYCGQTCYLNPGIGNCCKDCFERLGYVELCPTCGSAVESGAVFNCGWCGKQVCDQCVHSYHDIVDTCINPDDYYCDEEE